MHPAENEPNGTKDRTNVGRWWPSSPGVTGTRARGPPRKRHDDEHRGRGSPQRASRARGGRPEDGPRAPSGESVASPAPGARRAPLCGIGDGDARREETSHALDGRRGCCHCCSWATRPMARRPSPRETRPRHRWTRACASVRAKCRLVGEPLGACCAAASSRHAHVQSLDDAADSGPVPGQDSAYCLGSEHRDQPDVVHVQDSPRQPGARTCRGLKVS